MADGSLVGRDDEVTALRMALDPRGGSAVVAAEAGVGKTALCRVVADGIEAGGRDVLRVVATNAARGVPLGPLLGLLPPLPAGTPTTGPRDLTGLFHSVLATLRAMPSVPVVVVDDAHLLDEPSAALIHQAVAGGVVQVLATLRVGEPAPDAVRALWKDGLADRIELVPLSRTASAEMLRSLLGGPVDGRSETRIWDVTRGNPLFVREVVGAARRNGALAVHRGLWTWSGTIARDARLEEVCAQSMGALDPPIRALAEVVAAGERVPLALLRALPESAALGAAEDAGVLVVDPITDHVALAHPLYAEALCAAAGTTRVRDARARLVEHLPRDGATHDLDPLIQAQWLLDGSNDVDPALFVEAALKANHLSDWTLAARLARAVLSQGTDWVALRALTHALLGMGDSAAVAELLEPYIEIPGPSTHRVALAADHSRALFYGMSRVAENDDALDRWAVSMGDDHAARDIVLGIKAGSWYSAGRQHDSYLLAREIYDRAEDDRVRLSVISPLLFSLAEQGQVLEAQELAGEIFVAAFGLRAEIPAAPFMVIAAQMLCLLILGDLEAIDRMLDLGEAMYQGGDPEARGLLQAARGATQMLRGNAAAAQTTLASAIGLLESAGRVDRVATIAAALTEAAALCGDEASSREAMALARDRLRDSEAVFRPALERAAVWVTFVSNGTRAAAAEALALARQLETGGAPLWATTLEYFDAVRLGAGRDAIEGLVRTGRKIDGPFAAAMVSYGQARRGRGEPRLLQQVAETFATMGFLLYAAEAAVQAAAGHQSAGDVQAASLASEQARAWAQRCDGVRSPILTFSTERSGLPALTRREREIIELVVQGRSNREVADHLGVSVRTVEGHLSRAYAKLGVRHRSDLV